MQRVCDHARRRFRRARALNGRGARCSASGARAGPGRSAPVLRWARQERARSQRQLEARLGAQASAGPVAPALARVQRLAGAARRGRTSCARAFPQSRFPGPNAGAQTRPQPRRRRQRRSALDPTPTTACRAECAGRALPE